MKSLGSDCSGPKYGSSCWVRAPKNSMSLPPSNLPVWRRRRRHSVIARIGARTPQELPYFGPLQNLPKDFIDINLAFSRLPGQPKRYVQDLMRARSADLGALLKDPGTCLYVCGLKSMEEGVVLALHDIAQEAGLGWDTLGATLKREGRLHLETY